ncbi:DUF4865 family protein [Mesobacillus foraminis]|uniref:DUF4865 family protein n=1 Tax=Mesobacillus foraminis TaxID=279826 RepID=UPI0039A1C866
MLATQYKIILPSDYDMNIIKERVRKNGPKTDGFPGLKFKLYLITEKGLHNNLQNSYSPLYLWKDSNGLNKFLFEGYYDNILNSIGWQQVNVGIPLFDTTSPNILENTYLYHLRGAIMPQGSLNTLKEHIQKSIPPIEGAEFLVTYNPDQWKYDIFCFLKDINNLKETSGAIYQILYISSQF